jgi:hypothetical protein
MWSGRTQHNYGRRLLKSLGCRQRANYELRRWSWNDKVFCLSRGARALRGSILCENKAAMCWLPHQKIKETFLMTSHLLYTSDLTPPFLSLIKESCSIAAAAAAECKVCLRKKLHLFFCPCLFSSLSRSPILFLLLFVSIHSSYFKTVLLKLHKADKLCVNIVLLFQWELCRSLTLCARSAILLHIINT